MEELDTMLECAQLKVPPMLEEVERKEEEKERKIQKEKVREEKE